MFPLSDLRLWSSWQHVCNFSLPVVLQNFSHVLLPFFLTSNHSWYLILDFKVVKTAFAISDYLTRIALLKTAICYKNIDLRHFCRESREKHNIRVSTSKLWEYLQLRTSCKLCNPLTQSHIIISERVPAQCPRPRQVNHWNEEVFQVPAKSLLSIIKRLRKQDDDFEDETRFPKLSQ